MQQESNDKVKVMALFDLLTPQQVLQKRAEQTRNAVAAAQAQGESGIGEALGAGLGEFGLSFLRGAGFNVDPEMERATKSAKVLKEIEESNLSVSNPDDVLEMARKFREAGNLEQAIQLIDRASALRSASGKAEKAGVELDIKKADLAKKQADNLFAQLTRDARLKDTLAKSGISEEDLKRITLQNARRAQGLTPDPVVAKEPKQVKIDKDFDVSVDAVISRQLERAGVELEDSDVVQTKRDQIRSRARDIKNQKPSLSNEAAAEQAFSDLIGRSEAGAIGLFFGREAFKAKEDVSPVQPNRVRLKFPTQ